MTAITESLARVVAEKGWRPGTHLENQVAIILDSFKLPVRAAQQHQAGRYRLDFAWPSVLMAIEADGWWHRSPEGAAKDRERDCWLRSQGWVIFRVDDQHGPLVLEHQVMRVTRIVRAELATGMKWKAPATEGLSVVERRTR